MGNIANGTITAAGKRDGGIEHLDNIAFMGTLICSGRGKVNHEFKWF
jgi:hypothetical protein